MHMRGIDVDVAADTGELYISVCLCLRNKSNVCPLHRSCLIVVSSRIHSHTIVLSSRILSRIVGVSPRIPSRM